MAEPNNVDPTDIDKLLAEIDALNRPGPAGAVVPVQPVAGKAVAPTSPERSLRTQWAGIAAAGGGVLGLVTGGILPFVGGPSAGIGAALGAAVVAYLNGPPSWLGKEKGK
ncbi:MAG: hypothetical protein ACOYEV_07895 [Candidatus Nanopelagicales bacterium]